MIIAIPLLWQSLIFNFLNLRIQKKPAGRWAATQKGKLGSWPNKNSLMRALGFGHPKFSPPNYELFVMSG
jgi:hypothetical protein